MLITTRGIVISSREVGESDRSISIITDKLGVIDILAKGARKINSKNNASTQLFAYASFCFNERGGRYYLNSSEPVNIFYGIRSDIKKVALASYLADLVRYAVMALQPSEETMRLLLNTFYFLSESDISCGQLKAVFELRFACCIGHSPQLLGCAECLKFTDEVMYFFYNDGRLLCSEHYDPGSEIYDQSIYPKSAALSESMLHIIRLVCLSDMEKLFAFRLKGDTLTAFGQIAQRYLLEHLQHKFSTLDFYLSV